MKRIVIALVLVFVLAPATLPAADQCQRWEQARERIYQQLRRSHGASRGNQLRARLRELQALIFANCR